MKKYGLLFVIMALLGTSCSIDDNDEPNFALEIMPIISVDMPQQFVYGETYAIGVTYSKPNFCYEFNDFVYNVEGNERTIAVVNTVYTSNELGCNGEPEDVTVTFDFTVTDHNTYVFKFFQGEDNNTGTDQYHIVEVPVMNGRVINSN